MEDTRAEEEGDVIYGKGGEEVASDGTIKISTELDASKAKTALQKFSVSAKNAIGKSVSFAAKTATAAITAFAGYSVKVGADFEAGMSKVSAISGAAGDDLAKLTDKAKEMGAKTKFSATEAASAFEYMAMAGWKTQDMLNGIEGIMDLAAASGESLASTSDIVTDAMTAFGLSASDSGHFADVLAKAASSSNTNVGMMGATFKYAAPIAGALKYSIEDTATAIGLMANAGIKGEQAGTALRAMMTRLVDPPKEAAAALDDLKISAENSDGSMKPLREVLEDLREKFAGLDDSQKASYASAIAGQEAMSGLLAIVGASDSDFNSLVSSINNADGAAKSMADTMQDNLEGSVTILGSALEGFGIQVYERMQGSMKGIVDMATESVNRLSKAFTSGGLEAVAAEAGELFDELADGIASSSSAAAGIVKPMQDIVKTGGSMVKTVLPAAADSAAFLAQNFDVLAPSAVAAVGAFKAMKVVDSVSKWYKGAAAASKAYAAAMAAEGVVANASSTAHLLLASTMSAYELVVGVVTKRVPLATAAQTLWNKALNANPLGVAVVAAMAFAAAVAAIRASIKKETEAEREHSQEIKRNKKEAEEHAEAAKERRKSYEELSEAQDKQAAAEVTQLNNLQRLNSELRGITDKNGKVKEGEEARAAFITSQLSNALGIEISMTGNQINNYKDLQKEIKNLIQQKKIDAVMSAQQAKYEEAVAKQMEVAAEAARSKAAMEKAEADVAKEQETLERLRKESNDAVIAGNKEQVLILGEKIKKQEENVASTKESLAEEKAAYADSMATLSQYANDIEMYTSLVEAAESGNAEAIESAINRVTAGIKTANNATSAELQKQVETVANIERFIQEQVEAGTPSFEKAMLTQAQDATKAALEEFAKAAPQTAEELAKVSPEAVAALVGGNMKGQLSAEAQGAVQGMLNQFSLLDEGTKDAFAQAIYGAMEGLEGFGQLSDPATEGVEAFLESLRVALDEHSPSKKTEEIFRLAMEGAAMGVESGSPSVIEKAGGFISSLLGMFSETGIGTALQNAGSSIMNFFGLGMKGQSGNSKKHGKSNAEAAKAGACSVNPISAGSKFGQLLANGIAGAGSLLRGKGQGIANNAKTGAGAVNPIDAGVKFGMQYGSGISGSTADAGNKGKALATNAKSGAASIKTKGVGSDFGSGFVSGIGGWLGAAARKGAELAQAALNAVKKKQKSNSPSKVAKGLGGDFGEGYAIGISDKEKEVSKASRGIAQTAAEYADAEDIRAKLKELDVPAIMSDIYSVGEIRQRQMSEKVVAAMSAKEADRGEIRASLSEEDIQRLAKAFSTAVTKQMETAFDKTTLTVGKRQFGRIVREVR